MGTYPRWYSPDGFADCVGLISGPSSDKLLTTWDPAKLGLGLPSGTRCRARVLSPQTQFDTCQYSSKSPSCLPLFISLAPPLAFLYLPRDAHAKCLPIRIHSTPLPYIRSQLIPPSCSSDSSSSSLSKSVLTSTKRVALRSSRQQATMAGDHGRGWTTRATRRQFCLLWVTARDQECGKIVAKFTSQRF